MAFTNALSSYNRVDTIEVDCGSFSVELKSFQSVFKELGDEQTRLRSEGLLAPEPTSQPRKRLTRTAAALHPVQRTEETMYLLGSKERDQRFFAEHVLVGWKGLIDDDGKEVPYSVDSAMALFASPGGEELYSELTIMALDLSNFAGVRSVGDDVKNS